MAAGELDIEMPARSFFCEQNNEIISINTRRLYCVEWTQDSIRLEAVRYMHQAFPWAHPSPRCKQHLDRFSHFFPCSLTYQLTHKLFSFCIRRYLVSRACDWVMPALSAVLSTFIFKFSLFFFNISVTRPHQHRSVILVLIRNIRHQMFPKNW